MDALVYVSRGAVGAWDIYARDPKDLHLGTITAQEGSGEFTIQPDAELLSGVDHGPYSDLDAAMDAVGQKIGGSCRKWAP